jgi:hypothetical protein
MGAAFGAVFSVAGILSPAAAVIFSGYGILSSAAINYDVWSDSSATTGRKAAAFALFVTAIIGAGQSVNYYNAQKLDGAWISGTLREASQVQIGNSAPQQSGIVANVTNAIAAGLAWVGKGFKVSRTDKGQKILRSADGTRQFRFPSWKPREGKFQANFEQRSAGSTKWEGNYHIEVLYPSPYSTIGNAANTPAPFIDDGGDDIDESAAGTDDQVFLDAVSPE